MIDQDVPAPVLVGIAVLAYLVGVASLFLLQSAAMRRTGRGEARLRHLSRWDGEVQ